MSDPAAIMFGLAAALVLGVASVADQRSTKRVRRRGALSPTIFVDLIRQPLWLASIVLTVVGFALQVLALHFGPLALVEPLLVCDLIFAVLLTAYLRHGYDPILFGGVFAAAVGVAAFLAIARPTNGHSSVGFFVVLPLRPGHVQLGRQQGIGPGHRRSRRVHRRLVRHRLLSRSGHSAHRANARCCKSLGVSTGPGRYCYGSSSRPAGQKQIIARETEEGAQLPSLPTR